MVDAEQLRRRRDAGRADDDAGGGGGFRPLFVHLDKGLVDHTRDEQISPAVHSRKVGRTGVECLGHTHRGKYRRQSEQRGHLEFRQKHRYHTCRKLIDRLVQSFRGQPRFQLRQPVALVEQEVRKRVISVRQDMGKVAVGALAELRLKPEICIEQTPEQLARSIDWLRERDLID